MGLPVIALRGRSLSEIVEDGETGFLLESGDEHARIERLRVLAHNAEMRARMRHAARKSG